MRSSSRIRFHRRHLSRPGSRAGRGRKHLARCTKRVPGPGFTFFHDLLLSSLSMGEGERKSRFEFRLCSRVLWLLSCHLTLLHGKFIERLRKPSTLIRVLRFSGEKCAKTGFKLWPNCDKSNFTQKLTPYPWFFTFYCIFINKSFWNLEKCRIFFKNLYRKLWSTQRQDINEMKYVSLCSKLLP